MIQSEFFPRPRHPPLAFYSRHNCSRNILQTDSGGFASSWLQAPNKSNLGEKAGPSPAREKNPFFLRSHAVQLARVSLAAGDSFAYVLTPFTREMVSRKHYWIGLRI